MDLQGVLEGVLDTTPNQTAKHNGTKIFLGIPGGVCHDRGMMGYGTGFGHFGTPRKGSRLHGSAFQDFLNVRSAEGKGFLKENRVFLKDLQEKKGN